MLAGSLHFQYPFLKFLTYLPFSQPPKKKIRLLKCVRDDAKLQDSQLQLCVTSDAKSHTVNVEADNKIGLQNCVTDDAKLQAPHLNNDATVHLNFESNKEKLAQICVMDDAKLQALPLKVEQVPALQNCVTNDAKSQTTILNHKTNDNMDVLDPKQEIPIWIVDFDILVFESTSDTKLTHDGNQDLFEDYTISDWEEDSDLEDDSSAASIEIQRIRGGVGTRSQASVDGSMSSEMVNDASLIIAEQMRNMHGGVDSLREVIAAQGSNQALTLLGRSIITSIRARSQELEAISRQRLTAFHPAIEEVSTDFGEVTLPLVLNNINHDDHVRTQMDTDSIYAASTNHHEIVDLSVVTRTSMVNFRSITDRTSANWTTRFAFAGDDQTIKVRVRGKKPAYVNANRCPNVQLAKVDSPKAGVGTYIHLYYLGLNYLPDNPFFSNSMLAVVNICFNLARLKTIVKTEDEQYTSDIDILEATFCQTDVGQEIRHNRIMKYQACIQQIPRFECILNDNQRADKPKNSTSCIKGTWGGIFLKVFFEILEKIAMEDEGYQSQDPIWSHHYHGMGRDNTFVPDDLVRTATAIYKNHVIVAQSVGVKDNFMGEVVSNQPIHDAATFHQRCQTDLDAIVDRLSKVFTFPDDKNENMSPDGTMRVFADFGINIYPNDNDVSFLPDGRAVQNISQSILAEKRDGRRTTQQHRPEQMFPDHSIDDLINAPFDQDGTQNEAPLDDILAEDESKKMTSFSMLGTNGQVGNATSGKITITLTRNEDGKLHKIKNPRRSKKVAGNQLYGPWTKSYFRHDVRDQKQMFNRLPTIIMDLLSENGVLSEDLTKIRKEAKRTILCIEDIMFNVIDQLETFGANHVRYEPYFDLTESRKPQWPQTNFVDAVKTVDHSKLLDYIVDMSGRTIPPLRKLIDEENERGPNQRTDFNYWPPEAKTMLYSLSESLILLMGPHFYKSRIFDGSDEIDHVCEIPVARRKVLSPEVKSWTGLAYGADPNLLRLKAPPTFTTIHGTRRTTTVPLSRILASRLIGKVVIPIDFIEADAQIRAKFMQYARPEQPAPELPAAPAPAEPVAEDESELSEDEEEKREFEQQPEIPPEITEEEYFAFFDTIDFAALRMNLSEDRRLILLGEISRIILHLYEKEWRYYLLVWKKRRMNQVVIHYPRRRNKLSDMPVSYEEVLAFRQAEPMCAHILIPNTDLTIKTEGKLIDKTMFFCVIHDAK